jgi:crotonobetainyl-CoA:carnitine CoA-transferase CaiB-like acyl-CoA transferase
VDDIAADNEAMWERLAEAVGSEPLIRDTRFHTGSDRVANREELTRLVEEKLTKKNTREWGTILDAAGVANGPILHIDEVFQDLQEDHQSDDGLRLAESG